jgi:probable HAF family extracellular repeat protein
MKIKISVFLLAVLIILTLLKNVVPSVKADPIPQYQAIDLQQGNSYGRAVAINDSEQIAGWIVLTLPNNKVVSHAALWQNGTMTDLGT